MSGFFNSLIFFSFFSVFLSEMYLREKHSGDQLVGRGTELGMKVTRWYQNRAGGATREVGGDPPGKAELSREGSLSPDRLPAGSRQPKAEGDSGGTFRTESPAAHLVPP